jgi:hypothetical protein
MVLESPILNATPAAPLPPAFMDIGIILSNLVF